MIRHHSNSADRQTRRHHRRYGHPAQPEPQGEFHQSLRFYRHVHGGPQHVFAVRRRGNGLRKARLKALTHPSAVSGTTTKLHPFRHGFQGIGHALAFGLMVASHCDIFRIVGKFSQCWYLSDLYLEVLARKRHFGLISAKFERMARDLTRQPGNIRRLNYSCGCLQGSEARLLFPGERNHRRKPDAH